MWLKPRKGAHILFSVTRLSVSILDASCVPAHQICPVLVALLTGFLLWKAVAEFIEAAQQFMPQG
eukprot:5433263-Amphidinium_carterae.2